MKVGNLSNVQNFSGLQNITSNNQLTKPELKNNEVSETQTPQKQMVNAQMFLASMPNCSFKGGNNKECQELIDSVVSFINIEKCDIVKRLDDLIFLAKAAHFVDTLILYLNSAL